MQSELHASGRVFGGLDTQLSGCFFLLSFTQEWRPWQRFRELSTHCANPQFRPEWSRSDDSIVDRTALAWFWRACFVQIFQPAALIPRTDPAIFREIAMQSTVPGRGQDRASFGRDRRCAAQVNDLAVSGPTC